jgi:hypothetical protein
VSTSAQRRSYLSVIDWPPDSNRGQVSRLLAAATGLDAATLALWLGQPPPMAMPPMPTAAALSGAQALISAGGDGFVCSLADLEALGPTLKIRDLRLEHGALAVDLWRGPSTCIERAAIQFLVRAHLHDDSRGKRARAAARDAKLRALTSSVGTRLGWAARQQFNARMDDWAASEQVLRTSDKLDIHTTDGRVFQVDGDKFGYRILGDLRGHSDKVNMDRLCELLAHLAPNDVVDDFFSLWRPPRGFDRLRLPDMKINNDDPAFAFYSRWTALTYRYVLGVGAAHHPPGGLPGPADP